MKTPRIILALASTALFSQSAHAAVLAGWDSWSSFSGNNVAEDKRTTGFSGTIVYNLGTSGVQINGNFASTDGTFGTVGGASGNDSGLLVRPDNGNSLTLSITNSTGFAYTLQTINFDFAARANAGSFGPNGISVVYTSGGLGPAATQIGSVTGLDYAITNGTTGAESNYPDFDFNLSPALSDLVLANGESALFTFTFSGASGPNPTGVSSVIDNIAVTGTLVPEPSALLLSALGSLALLRRKR